MCVFTNMFFLKRYFKTFPLKISQKYQMGKGKMIIKNLKHYRDMKLQRVTTFHSTFKVACRLRDYLQEIYTTPFGFE